MSAARPESIEAFAEIYDRTVSRVHGVVLGVVGDRDVALRVTEEVYLAAWERTDVLAPRPTAWVATLLALAHRTAVEHVRSRAREVNDPSGCTARCCGPADEVTSGEGRPPRDASPVGVALAALPEVQRRVVELAYYGGHSCTEIERLLHAPPGSVAEWMTEGVSRLRSATVSGLAGPGGTMAP